MLLFSFHDMKNCGIFTSVLGAEESGFILDYCRFALQNQSRSVHSPKKEKPSRDVSFAVYAEPSLQQTTRAFYYFDSDT